MGMNFVKIHPEKWSCMAQNGVRGEQYHWNMCLLSTLKLLSDKFGGRENQGIS